VKSLLELAAAVGQLEPPCFIFGGVGEDAVLDGSLTRPHSDVDVMIPRSELDLRMEQFAALGYREWETWLADRAGRPQVLHGSIDGIDLELSILDGESRDLYFELTAPDGRVLHLLPPSDVFAFGRVTLDGESVQTVSPLALYSIRMSLAASGAFGEFRVQDAPVQQRLRDELLSGVPDAELAPRLRPA
jgi:hypothetical protein